MGGTRGKYLERRRLDDDAIRTFQLGYAPNSRSALTDAMSGRGFTTAEMAEAGLLVSGDDIPGPTIAFVIA